MSRVLPQKFFNRPALVVAKELLGKFLVRRIGNKNIAVIITETEAYVGPHDLASHASRGRTPRTEIMFGESGRFYVYFTYGMHWMLNVVTGQKGYPAAVLIRAGIVCNNLGDKRPFPSFRIQRRNLSRLPRSPRSLAMTKYLNGPARLTKFLKIDKRWNGKLATPSTSLGADRRAGLWFEDRGIKIKPGQIKRGPRIGVDYAKEWAKKEYNFILVDFPFLNSTKQS